MLSIATVNYSSIFFSTLCQSNHRSVLHKKFSFCSLLVVSSRSQFLVSYVVLKDKLKSIEHLWYILFSIFHEGRKKNVKLNEHLGLVLNGMDLRRVTVQSKIANRSLEIASFKGFFYVNASGGPSQNSGRNKKKRIEGSLLTVYLASACTQISIFKNYCWL